MSKHICWRGFKRMCDRCSHSLFHAPHLNNSPCSDNPCTPDHLHGTPEPRNFRLRPSVCFCSITAAGTQGAPFNTALLSRRRIVFSLRISFPRFTHVLLHMRPAPQWALLELLCWPRRRGLQGEHITGTAVVWAEVLSCISLSHRGLEAGGSTTSLNVQESQSPQLVIEQCRSTHSGGIICADSCGIRLLKQWHLLIPFLPSPCLPLLPPLCIPIRRPSMPCWDADWEVKWLHSCSSMSSPGLFTITVEGKK